MVLLLILTLTLNLTFGLSTPKPYQLRYLKIIPYTKFKHFGPFLSGQTSIQTNRQTNNNQTDSNILPTPAWVIKYIRDQKVKNNEKLIKIIVKLTNAGNSSLFSIVRYGNCQTYVSI